MPRYKDYTTKDAPPGGVFLTREDGSQDVVPANHPDAFLEMARIDEDKARLARDEAKLPPAAPVPEVHTSDLDLVERPDGMFVPQTVAGSALDRQEQAYRAARAPADDFAARRAAAIAPAPDARIAMAPTLMSHPDDVSSPPPPPEVRADFAPAMSLQPPAPMVSTGPAEVRASVPAMSAAPPGWENSRDVPAAPRLAPFATPGGAGGGGVPGGGGDGGLVDLTHNLTLAAMRQGGGPARRVAARTDEIGSQRQEGGVVDPLVVQNAGVERRLSAQRAVDAAQAKADVDYDTVQKQQAAARAIDEDAAIRRLQRQADMTKLHDEQVALAKDIGESKPDQKAFWGNAGTASKVTAGIGLLLGGFGAAVQGAATGRAVDNTALSAFNAAIDRDLAAQRDLIANKKTNLSALGEAYQRYRQAGLDDEHATEAARGVAMQRIATEASAMANATGNRLAEERAATLRQQADQDVADMRLKLAEEAARQSSKTTHYKTTPEHMVGGGPSLLQRIHLGQGQQQFEDAHKRSEAEVAAATAKAAGGGATPLRFNGADLVIPGLGTEEVKDIRKSVAQRNEVLAGIAHLRGIYNDAPTGSVVDHAAAAAVRQKLVSQINNAVGAGAASDPEAKAWKDAIGGFRGGAGLDALTDDVNQGTKAYLDTYGARKAR